MESYDPPNRWLTYQQLMDKWSKLIGKEDAKAKIANLRPDFPVRIVTQGREICMYSKYECDLIEQEFGAKAATVEPPKNWILRVQAQAAIEWKKYQKMQCNPTKHSIKDELARWCKDNNVRTPTHIIPSADYIYRHVLRNWDPPS
ncbi:hypothetical protein SAMN05216404_103297 [Nitrosospira multiformis]|uniref:Uncharacterized protein n=1 Tax=Nitrosospira multiformis TaxID=1231 RepID=A0A1H8FDN1_9PROT|nr:hypothetical protein SAMN05216404_103297 [Nitrosospira multiformis]